MKNLKKVLSLVLALAMAMSLMTAAFAADTDFADADEINNTEAVTVMAALGVLQGNNGEFDPQGNLTRETAAKIICYMLLGEEGAEALTVAGAPFDDVAANRWSAPFIAYCAEQGIIAGNGAGKFYPTVELTSLQFAKMCLIALGYSASNENLTGDAWGINASALAVSAGLNKDLGSLTNTTMTREAAAQMAFNMLTATLVQYTGGTEVVLPDGTKISAGATRSEVNDPNVTEYNNVTGATTNSYTQFVERYFPELTKEDVASADEDVFGRPSDYAWELDGEDDAVYVASKAATKVFYGKQNAKDIWKALGMGKNDSITATVTPNGGSTTTATISKTATGTVGAQNSVVEVYYDKDNSDIDIITIQYNVTTVKKVVATTYDKDGDVKKEAHVVLDASSYEYETTAFEKDDVVLYALVSGAVEDLILADSIEGKVTAKKGNDLTINGKVYTNNNSTAALGSNGTYYLGVDGEIVYFDGIVESSDDYAYIYKVVKNDTKVNDEGFDNDDVYTAYVIKADGTKASYVIDSDMIGSDAGDWFEASNASKYTGVVCYTINKDGEITGATAATTGVTAKASYQFGKTTAVVNGKYANASTTFVFAKENSKKMEVTVATGYKNVAAQTANCWIVYNTDDDKIITIFVADEAAADSTAVKDMYILLDNEASVTKDEDDNDVYTYSVMLNGKETTLSSTTAAVKTKIDGMTEGDMFTVTLTDNMIKADTDVTAIASANKKTGTVSALVEDYVVLTGTNAGTYYFAETNYIYLVDTDDGYVLTETTLAKDDVVTLYVIDDDDDGDVDDIVIALVTTRA